MATILKLTDGIAVENDSLRLTFPLAEGLIGHCLLHGRKGDRFQLAATADPVAEISYRTGDGSTLTERITAASYEMDRRGSDCILRLESEFHDTDGVRWSFSAEFYVPDQGPRVTVTGRLSANRPRHLVAFRCPFLRIDDDPKRSKRKAAIFPGLDWVVGDEQSSSAETAPSPFHRRHVPHPYKITVPAMAVAQDGLVTGITWDPLQVWDGERVASAAHRYPTAVFESPNFTEGTPSHLMGLFLPSVPKFVDEGSLAAARPYQMTPGREISLECNLFVHDSSDVVDAVREHLNLSGLIPPPPKPRDYKESLELDLETYLNRAWSAKQAGWAHSSSSEEKWTFYSEFVALALWRASLFAKDAKLKTRMRECVESAINAHGGVGGLPLAYFRGGFDTELELAKGQLDKLERVQQADGGWAAEKDPAGRKREKSLAGLTAQHAAKLLRSALLTGDRGHLDAGIRAIRFLDGVDRPCGLRVWDVHENAPDLLAVAHLIAACLDEHLLTGNPARLERAIYWAWAGLPFVFLWHAHDRDIMRYATVPFFAVTRMDKKPWFGVAAQWNGLSYARELFHVARHDRSMRWHRVARAITLCAMQLQKDEGNQKGFYSDAYNLVDGRDYYPLGLNPQLITRNVLHLLGEDIEPRCEVVPWQEKRVRVATVAQMLAIRSSPRQLIVRLGYHAKETCYLTLAECDKPSQVQFGEQPLDEIDDVADARRAWHYDEERGLTIVRLRFRQPEEVLEFRF
ncbi:MAG: hypothetical protein ABIF82_12600 [Planctomycetota bacterium]